MAKQETREFLRGHYLGDDRWHDWIGEMKTDELGLQWKQELEPEQKAKVDTLLRTHCIVNGPLAFGGPWTYIVPASKATLVDKALSRA